MPFDNEEMVKSDDVKTEDDTMRPEEDSTAKTEEGSASEPEPLDTSMTREEEEVPM